MWQPTREEVVQRLREMYQFVDKYRSICDAHSVDFYLHDNWNCCLPQKWKEEILTMKDEKWFIDPPGGTANDGSFLSFLHEASRLRLPLSSIADAPKSTGPDTVSFGMSAKKSHEVERFSSFVKSFVLERCAHTSQVLDVGSGKGYLSDHLARTCGVTVIGLDSQPTNTEGAMKRSKKVSKECKNVRKRFEGIPCRHPQTETDFSLKDISFSDESLSLCNLFTGSEDTTLLSAHEVCSKSEEVTSESNVTQITKDTSLNEVNTGTCISKSNASNPPQPKKEHSNLATQSSSFCPITMEIAHSNFDLLLMNTEKLSSGKFVSQKPFCIVGLHACGDLTSTALRMFSAVPTASAVCVVGCCYHHITEEGTAPGFPLSGYMKSVGAYLGRTTRMLACQTLARFTETTSNEALLRIHWRAVLQVLLSRKFPELFSASEGQETELVVGRMKKPLQEFHQYCVLALQRLHLDPNKINKEDIGSTELEYSSKVMQLQGFIRVRTVLAACIECVLLLDRLLFLHEQESTSFAGLVQLFDPVTSPRCYCLVAIH